MNDRELRRKLLEDMCKYFENPDPEYLFFNGYTINKRVYPNSFKAGVGDRLIFLDIINNIFLNKEYAEELMKAEKNIIFRNVLAVSIMKMHYYSGYKYTNRERNTY